MGSSNQFHIKAPDCPGCGREGAGIIGSSQWGHWINCCSDECGLKIADILRENVNKKKYTRLENKIDNLRAELIEMEHEGLPEGCVNHRPGKGFF